MRRPSRDEVREKLAALRDAIRNRAAGAADSARGAFDRNPGLARTVGLLAAAVVAVIIVLAVVIGQSEEHAPDQAARPGAPVPAISSSPRPPERDTSPGTGAPPNPGAPPEPGRASGEPTPSASAGPGPSAAPSTPSAPPQPAPVRPPSAAPIQHRVAPGETLAAIALRYDVPFEQIAADNGITNPNRIRAGRQLVVKPRPAGVEVIQPGSTLSGYASRHGRSVDELMRMNPQLTNPDRILAGGRLNV